MEASCSSNCSNDACSREEKKAMHKKLLVYEDMRDLSLLNYPGVRTSDSSPYLAMKKPVLSERLLMTVTDLLK